MSEKLKPPTEILPHSIDYKDNSWIQYEIWEYGMWAHLLVKRSQHRKTEEKAEKDLRDAFNYLIMAQKRVEFELKKLEHDSRHPKISFGLYGEPKEIGFFETEKVKEIISKNLMSTDIITLRYGRDEEEECYAIVEKVIPIIKMDKVLCYKIYYRKIEE
jgi:hypothetical protein